MVDGWKQKLIGPEEGPVGSASIEALCCSVLISNRALVNMGSI